MEQRAYRSWAVIRRVQYGIGFFLFWTVILVPTYLYLTYQAPTCFDQIANADERGVDCGGSCVRICAADVLPPVVIWAKSFKIVDGQYNAVAHVENRNQAAGSREMSYTFELLSAGEVIVSRSGVTELPPGNVFPIFEGRIETDPSVEITDTRLTLEPVALWQPATAVRGQFRSKDIALSRADSRPKLDVKIENTELLPAEDVQIVATIYNDAGEAVTASQTYEAEIAGRSTKPVVFTWPQPIAKTVRSCIVPTDVAVAIDLSGSMNNDGDNPPQPVTDALAAASTFVSSLQPADQVGVVSFASDAAVVTQLGNSIASTAAAIRSLTITPEAETGFTNTPAALTLAQAELNSLRHNEDARRVLVLLTDGLPTAPGDEDVVTAAQTAATSLAAGGVEVYAIGLGQNVGQDFVRSIASAPENAYFAPTGADLAAIYAEITSALCEAGPAKFDILVKPKTSFTPLR